MLGCFENGTAYRSQVLSVRLPETFNSFYKGKKLFLMIPFCCYFLQKVSEKVGGAEGTKLDDDFKEMERVSLYIFAFPWHQVVRCKKENVKLFCTRDSKCSVS